MGRNRNRGVSFREWAAQQLKNPEVRKAYEEISPEVDFAIQAALAREERKMTQKQLAKRADIKQQDLSEIENGKRNITARTMTRIADALGYKVEVRLVKKPGKLMTKGIRGGHQKKFRVLKGRLRATRIRGKESRKSLRVRA